MPLTPQLQTVTIASGQTTSGIVDLRGVWMQSVLVPTIDSGTFKIQGSLDGATFYDVKDTSGSVLCSWGASTGGFLCDGDSIARLAGIRYLRFVCGAAQTATRVISIMTSQG